MKLRQRLLSAAFLAGLTVAACDAASEGTMLADPCINGMCPAGFECMLDYCIPIAAATSETGSDTSDSDTGEGDTTGDGDGDGDGPLSLSADIQPIWDANCIECHTPGGVSEYLDLSEDAFDDLVGVPSPEAPGSVIVQAGNSGASYLVAKLRGTQVEFGGLGGQMPAGSGANPLPEATISLIEQWIDEGALP
jgi:hypothetical protein